jgi:integrase/recombinase XerD
VNGTLDVDDLVVHYVGDTIRDKVRKVLKACGIYDKGRAVHAFRHTFATETLKSKGGNVRLTQELLDHKNISTTQIYTHIVMEQKKKAVADLPY